MGRASKHHCFSRYSSWWKWAFLSPGEKFLGDLTYEWVGFGTDLERFMVGISEKRAIWVADWCQKKLDHTSVLMQEVMEVLGRLVFATQAVEHVKPLWGPLFAWTAAVPSGLFVELPLKVRLTFKPLIRIFRDASMRMVEVFQRRPATNRGGPSGQTRGRKATLWRQEDGNLQG
jgi:hypothetical protein